MATLTPSPFTIDTGSTQQLTVTGGSFAGTKWGIRPGGVGSVSQTGLLTAGGVAGSTIVRLMYDTWTTIGAGLNYNTDNTLTVNTAGSYFDARSGARLTVAGDEVTYFWTNKFSPGLFDGGTLIQIFNGVVYHGVSSVFTPSPALTAGDLVTFVRLTTTQLGLKINGTLVHTFATATSTGGLQPVVTCYAPGNTIGDMCYPPEFSGSGITGYLELRATGTVNASLLTPREGLELYCDASLLSGLSDNSAVTSFTDQSGNGRHLTAASSKPVYKTNIVNGKPVIRWDGTKNPLSNATSLVVRCGWIVAKFNGSSFASYMGLLTGQNFVEVLKSDNSGTLFDLNGIPQFEYRLNNRIYPYAGMEAPMNAFKVIFFRCWQLIAIDGPQLGQNRNQTSEKWNGDVAMLALYSRDFLEEEILTQYLAIGANFNLFPLADVYPYQADITGHNETQEQTINMYDPPEGDRISEAIGDPKRVLDLKFSVADETEFRTMKASL